MTRRELRAGVSIPPRDIGTKHGPVRADINRAATSTNENPLPLPTVPTLSESTTVKAARRLNRAAGMIAASVLADSAMEHYRGSFHNKAMWTPLISSALSLAVSVHGHRDKKHGAHRGRDAVYAAAALTGIVGTAFHLYNITKKPGGLSWQNVFYSAPIGASGGPVAFRAHGISLRARARQPAGNAPNHRWRSRQDGRSRR